MELIENLKDGEEKNELMEIQDRLINVYDSLSEKYHSEKTTNKNNSLVLG